MTSTQTQRPRTERCPINLRPDTPACFLPVNWRWLRAMWRLKSRSRRGERQDDEWVRLALKAQRWDRKGKASKYALIFEARSMIGPNGFLLAELEARILANQSISAISTAIGLSEELIQTFEALFFDVRSRLHASDWVTLDVLGPRFIQPWLPRDVTLAWRAFGYLYGASAVDLLVSSVDRLSLIEQGLPAYWSKSSRLPKQMQLMLLSRSSLEQGPNASMLLNRFHSLGFCNQLPHFDSPPKDCSVKISGDCSWEVLGSRLHTSRAKRAAFKKAA